MATCHVGLRLTVVTVTARAAGAESDRTLPVLVVSADPVQSLLPAVT